MIILLFEEEKASSVDTVGVHWNYIRLYIFSIYYSCLRVHYCRLRECIKFKREFRDKEAICITSAQRLKLEVGI